jgi:formate dehydrogenase
MAFWIQEAINALSGNLDRFGGTLVGRGAVDFPALGKKLGFLLRTDRTRIGSFPSVSDCFAGGVLADEIMTPGPGQVRALFCTGGNPVNTMANGPRLKEALSSLELLVSVDIFLNETATLAHYVLPATSFFEMPDIHFIFPLLCGLQMIPYTQATGPMVEPDGQQRNPAHIYIDLARACGVGLFGSRLAGAVFNAGRFFEKRGMRFLALTPERLFSIILRACGLGSFGRLLKHPHGRLRPPHRENDFLGTRVLTDDGLVDLAPAALMGDAARLDTLFENELKSKGGLRLITRRAVRTHNSWMHNLPEFVSGRRQTNYLYMHPCDAEARGLDDGDLADVSSATGRVRLPVELHDDLMPGVVALPHGWGHQHAPGMTVASKISGVNVNILAADGPENLEPVSGMTHLTGIAVEVSPAAGSRHSGSWSGLPEE